MIQSLAGSHIVGQTDQQFLLSIIRDDLFVVKLALYKIAALGADAAEQHIDVRGSDLGTGGVAGGNAINNDALIGSGIPTLLGNQGIQAHAILLELDFGSQQLAVVQIVGNDCLDLSGFAVDGDGLNHFKGLLGNSRIGSHRRNHAQQQAGAEDQHEPALLQHLGAEGQGDQACQRSNGQRAINGSGQVPGLGRSVFATAGLGSGSHGSGCLGGRSLSSGDLHNGDSKTVSVGNGLAGSDGHSVRLEQALDKLNALGDDQLGTDIVDVNGCIGNIQRNADGISANIVGLVGSQDCVQAVSRFLCRESGGAEHENRQQKYQCQEN